MRWQSFVAAGCALLSLAGLSFAQAVRALPYSAQLATDPAVGNVQGIQRYGRPLMTDPDQGEGFSYHVYPAASGPALVGVAPSQGLAAAQGAGAAGGGGLVTRAASTTDLGATLRSAMAGSDDVPGIAILDAKLKVLEGMLNQGGDEDRLEKLREEMRVAEKELRTAKVEAFDDLRRAEVRPPAAAPMAMFGGAGYAVPYPKPFNWTAGLHTSPVPAAPGTPFPDVPGGVERAAVISRAGTTYETTAQIYHQPLIQIKMRVVEVARTDGLSVSSVLEYVNRANSVQSLTSGLPLNEEGGQGYENFRELTRFPVEGLIPDASTGTGMLLNLTSEHINWVTRFLATEMNGDVITAPEVVTLNGQNVEFVAGEKLPFHLGQNVIQGTNNNIQQVFYKHVGTLVSVTPRIVNWGLHGEGKGQAAIVANDVLDWNGLIRELLATKLDLTAEVGEEGLDNVAFREKIKPYAESKRPVPFTLKSQILKALNDYTKNDLLLLKEWANLGVIDAAACQSCRNWRPEDCTIDLAVVVRLSEGADVSVDGDGTTLSEVSIEEDVRAVANVVQVKSGHGVVMAGLISESEEDVAAKVPVLGDVPIVGFLFRSKATARGKKELLIFIEAQVLDPDPCLARVESAHDFRLGQPYVAGEFLANPLELGMCRVGFGTYLPPHSSGECVFWERFGRKIRKIRTHVDDAAE